MRRYPFNRQLIPEGYICLVDAAEKYDVNYDKLYDFVRRYHWLPYIKVKRFVCVREVELERLISYIKGVNGNGS